MINFQKCLYTISINQRIKTIKLFDSFDSLINLEVVQLSYFNEGHHFLFELELKK